MARYSNDEIMDWIVKNPDNVNIVYAKTNTPVKIKDMVREEEKKLRIKRLTSKRKKLAFAGEKLESLQNDRKIGMSIRQLANKYDCSTRTIQKYLKASKADLQQKNDV